MSIKHSDRSPFFPVKSEYAQDRSLSYAARGILIELLSRSVGFWMNLSDLEKTFAAEGLTPDEIKRIYEILQTEGYAL